jgi:hypothetical protein
MSQKIRNNYITSEVYKNFIIPVNLNTEENREIISNKKVTFKYNSLDEILQKMDCKYFPL